MKPYNIKAIHAHLCKNDNVLKRIIENSKQHFNLTPSDKYFEILLTSVISQQLSLKAADTIRKRVYALMNDKISPKKLLQIEDQTLRDCGLSWAKVSYVKDVAYHFEYEKHKFDTMESLSDEEAIQLLCSIKGIGEWSAQMFLMFTLTRLNVLPTADVGFQNGVKKFYNLNEKPTKKQLLEISEKWKPYRSVAVWYLWQAKDDIEFVF